MKKSTKKVIRSIQLVKKGDLITSLKMDIDGEEVISVIGEVRILTTNNEIFYPQNKMDDGTIICKRELT